jgi:hypothetical protein
MHDAMSTPFKALRGKLIFGMKHLFNPIKKFKKKLGSPPPPRDDAILTPQLKLLRLFQASITN